MLRGLDITYITLYEWIKIGMPVIKQNPYLFDVGSLKWVVKNKENYSEKAKKMLEVSDGV